MDDITRQFLLLVRKIQGDIHQAVEELSLIHQTSDPSYEKPSAAHDSDSPEKENDVLTAIKTIQDANHSADAKKYALDHRRYRLEWKGYRVSRLTVIFLFFYTTLTLIIAFYSIRSANAARDAANATSKQVDVYMDGLSAQVDITLDFDKLVKDGEAPVRVENHGPGIAKDVGWAAWINDALPVFYCGEFTWPNFAAAERNLSAAEDACLSQKARHTFNSQPLPEGEGKELLRLSNKISPANVEMEQRRPTVWLMTACYQDIFNRQHFSGLCVYWSNKWKRFMECTDASHQPCGKP